MSKDNVPRVNACLHVYSMNYNDSNNIVPGYLYLNMHIAYCNREFCVPALLLPSMYYNFPRVFLFGNTKCTLLISDKTFPNVYVYCVGNVSVL